MATGSEAHSFRASEARLYSAVLRTVARLGYSIKHSDATSGVVSFNTGMSMRSWAGQDMTIAVTPGADPTTSTLMVGGTRAQIGLAGGQIYDWGERGKIARTFLQALEKVLKEIPETTTTRVPQTAAPRDTVFEPDGVYAGIPYKVLETQAIDALMGGHLVRFRNMDQFVAAATGKTST